MKLSRVINADPLYQREIHTALDIYIYNTLPLEVSILPGVVSVQYVCDVAAKAGVG